MLEVTKSKEAFRSAMWNQKPCFRFEIDNFSEQEVGIVSQTFVSDGCEWYLDLHPKGDNFCDDHLSLYMSVANPKSLGKGWKRSVNYYFILLNQSEKELYRSAVQKHTVFQAKSPSWGFPRTLPLSKFQEKGFLENDRLIFEVYIQIVEAFNGEGGDVLEKKKTVDINGFQVLASQVTPTRKIFVEHPDLADDFKPKNQVVRMEYMNILLNLIVTLDKPSQDHSETELRNAQSELTELMEAGFKLDWLKLKLDEVSMKRKKAVPDVQQHERVNNLDIKLVSFNIKLDCLKSKLEEVSLERKNAVADVQQLVERVKNLEMLFEFKLPCLNSKLEEVSLGMKKSDDADDSRFQTLEERVKNLELMDQLDCLNAKLDLSRVQQLEKSVKNLKMMVSDLKVELDKERAKSSADGFLLVDEVA